MAAINSARFRSLTMWNLLLLLLSIGASAVNTLLPPEIVGDGQTSNDTNLTTTSNSSQDCRSWEFICNRDNLCIPIALRCDERDDCSDGEDELGCTLYKCDKAFFFACKYDFKSWI